MGMIYMKPEMHVLFMYQDAELTYLNLELP